MGIPSYPFKNRKMDTLPQDVLALILNPLETYYFILRSVCRSWNLILQNKPKQKKLQNILQSLARNNNLRLLKILEEKYKWT
jgi:hypothetical protein